MISEKFENKKNVIDAIKFWFNNMKKRWLVYILKGILYLMPLLVINPSINEYTINNFVYVMCFVFLIFLFNESLETHSLLKTKESIEKLTKENQELKRKYIKNEQYSENIGLYLENIPKEFLRNVSKFLKLKNYERISLYVLAGNKFHIIGRYSENPTYDRNGRDSYPAESGYISKCLSNDNGKEYYVKEKLPADNKKYLEVVTKEALMSEDEINKLSMKSKSYFARVIKDEKKNVGVLVIESTKSKFDISAENLNSKLKELSVHHMATLLDISDKLKGEDLNG